MQRPNTLNLTEAAYEREAERQRHMAHRAARCRDLAPVGVNPDQWALRLERSAMRLSSKGH